MIGNRRREPRKAGAGPRRLGPYTGQWVGIAANAGSGRGVGRRAVESFATRLEGYRIGCRIAWTPADRVAMVADAAADASCRCLVAAGGDGTVSALINERPGVPIAVLPAGTENLFARHFRFDGQPELLARAIAEGSVSSLDLGTAGQRRFSLMAGVGFDADVVTRHHAARLARTGRARPTHRAAYVEPVLRSSFSYRFPSLTVRIDDPGAEETIEGTTVFMFNLPRYAMGLPFAPSARGDDGRLDLVVFREPGPFRALHYLWLVLLGRHLRRDDVQHRRVRSATVECGEAVPFQLDGDPGGLVDPAAGGGLSVGILPGEVEVIVP
ncbi:MAG TPA: diacylglycerol kinase family protein [Isosphaeraceae bacterium]